VAKHDEVASEQRIRVHLEAYTRHAQTKFPEMLTQTITCDWLLA
jgi:hypothetical protein